MSIILEDIGGAKGSKLNPSRAKIMQLRNSGYKWTAIAKIINRDTGLLVTDSTVRSFAVKAYRVKGGRPKKVKQDKPKNISSRACNFNVILTSAWTASGLSEVAA